MAALSESGNLPADLAGHARRRVVIFTAGYDSPSTVEAVEAVSRAFPGWELLVLQEHRPRRLGAYLRSKIRRWFREPVSYPLEILTEQLARVLSGKLRPSAGRVGLPRNCGTLAAANVTCRVCTSLSDPKLLSELRDFSPWLGVALAAPVLRPEVFSLPELGTINLHKSLLPNYRGMPPGFWELHDNAAQTGATVHWVDEGLDTGDIIVQRAMAIPRYSTAGGLAARLDEFGEEILLEALRMIEAGRVDRWSQVANGRRANRRPAWLLRQRVRLGLLKRRRCGRLTRDLAKRCVLLAYVQVWARLRNLPRWLAGDYPVTVLLYHRVSDDYLDSVTVGVGQFKRQLEFLRRHYDVLDLRTFLATRGQARNRPVAVITFDDGYGDNYLAARLLRRVGLPCTFFLSTSMIGTGRAFEHDLKKLGHPVPALNWDQVRQMAAWGFTFGNHTANHADLGSLPVEQGLAEIQQAQAVLCNKLAGQSEAVINALAFPFGMPRNMQKAVLAILDQAGITACLSARGGQNSPDFDVLDVQRQGINHSFSLPALQALIEGWRSRLSRRTTTREIPPQ